MAETVRSDDLITNPSAQRWKRWSGLIASTRSWWADHRETLLRFAIALMVIAALLRLRNEFYRLLWDQGRTGAIDLKTLHKLVHQWFAGFPVYGEMRSGYPPATYPILWPFLGWLAVTPARWLWAVTTVMALGCFAYLLVRESKADARLEQAFIVLLLLSMYATSTTIGNGQLIVHMLPALVAGLLLFHRRPCGWREDLLGAVLVLVTLVKPTISVPFFWIVLFVPGRLRPTLFLVLGYVALTVFAAGFQEAGVLSLLQDWLARGSEWAVVGGYANLHSWLAALGLDEWILPSSLLALVALGLWTHRHRHGDLWLLLGVAALVARFWTYHRLYDDLLILLPMIALFRIAKRGSSASGGDVGAGVLLAVAWAAALAPASPLNSPTTLGLLFRAGQTIIWITMLIFLLDHARREKTAMVT